MSALKKPVSLLLTLLLLLAAFAATPVPIFAADSSTKSTGDESLAVYTEGNYEYTVSDNKATITKYIGHAAKVVVPSTIGGYPVECIGYMDSELVSEYNNSNGGSGWVWTWDLDIKNKGAFYNNTRLNSVTIPGSVKTIGVFAFRGCSNLSEVKICDGVENIWLHAFKECSSLKKIELPESIIFVSRDAFDGGNGGDKQATTKEGITDLTIHTNFDFTSANLPNDSVVNLTVSEGSTQIPENAFINFNSLRNVILPEMSLTDIGDSAFSGCDKLKRLGAESDIYDWVFDNYIDGIEIPRSVKRIGKSAFSYCEGIDEVILHRTLQKIDDWAFKDCENLAQIILPNTLSYLGKGAFWGCESIKYMDIPGSIGVLRSFTFCCSGLEEVTLYQGLTNVQKSAFNINTMDYETNHEYYEEVPDFTPWNRLPDGSYGNLGYFYNVPIEYEAYGCSLKKITCADSVWVDGNYTFNGTSFYSGASNEMKSPPDVIISTKAAPVKSYAAQFENNWEEGDNPTEYQDTDAGNNSSPFSDLSTLIGICGGTEALLDYIGTDLDLSIPESLQDSMITKVAIHELSNLDITSIDLPSSLEEIGPWAFRGCKHLGKAVLKEGLKEIGKYAFENCGELVDIDLPEGLTYLGDGTFSECISLSDIEIPEGLTFLGNAVFENCKSLRNIEIPDDIKLLGTEFFSNCSSLTDIELPDELTSLGAKAFSACKSLKNIEIPDGVKSIRDSVFSDCISLESINLPEGITEIGNGSFSGCTNLTDIDIPDSVKTISAAAFENCTNLESVDIPDGVTTISSYAFRNCKSLKSITIPDSVTSIASNAFEGCKELENIHLPDTITDIAVSAFKDCSGLNSIDIPDNITSIPSTTFYHCSGLQSIELPDSLAEIADSAFALCGSVKSIDFPDSLTSIGERAFSRCGYLENIELPENVTSIGDYSFEQCSELVSVKLPDDITDIGKGWFLNCSKLKEINLDGIASISEEAFSGCKNLVFSEIPESVATISKNAFRNCNSLTSLTIPENVTIENGAFYGCSKLVIYGEDYGKGWEVSANSALSFAKYTVTDGNAVIDFYWSNNVTSDLVIPTVLNGNPVTGIDDSVFEYVRNIKHVELPDGIKTIGEEAFSNCTNLEDINLPDSITRIGGRAFNYCVKLQSIVIPDSLTSLGSAAFSKCTKLKTLTVKGNGAFDYNNIPRDNITTLNVTGTSIKDDAFKEMEHLYYLNIADTVTSIGNRAFSDSERLNYLVIPDSVESIGADAFKGCWVLKTAQLPSGLTKISSGMFDGCKGLLEISIPEGVEIIEDNAFYNCYSLGELDFPENVKTIGENAFGCCDNLPELVLPSTIESVDKDAFKGCSRLETAYVWGRTTTIGDSAFDNCKDDLTIYAYDSSPADDYALENDVDFIPLLSINKGDSREDAPLIGTQSVENDGNNFGLNLNEYNNFELLGVQIKKDAESKDIRFVAVINEGIVYEAAQGNDIEDYGFVIAKCSTKSTAATSEENIKKITIDNPKTLAVSCKNSSNRMCGDYGVYNKPTKYKYTTLAVNNVDTEQGIVARFYVKTKSGRVYYASYNGNHSGCVTNYSRLASIEKGENSLLLEDEWSDLPTLSDEEKEE